MMCRSFCCFGNLIVKITRESVPFGHRFVVFQINRTPIICVYRLYLTAVIYVPRSLLYFGYDAIPIITARSRPKNLYRTFNLVRIGISRRAISLESNEIIIII